MLVNHYSVLRVSPTASTEKIRLAYKAKVKQTHPDRGGKRADFTEVRQAWATLRDPQARQLYDRELAAAVARARAVLCPQCGEAHRVPPDSACDCVICDAPLPRRTRTSRDAVGAVADRVVDRAVALGDQLTERLAEAGDRMVDGLTDVLIEGVDRGLDALRRKLGLRGGTR